jgi:hypothetical protein
MGRAGHHFRHRWHHRHLELVDGDTLTWLVVDRPGRRPFIAYFRGDRRGGVHDDDGHRLLVEHGHPDALIPRTGAHAGGAFH